VTSAAANADCAETEGSSYQRHNENCWRW